MTSRACRAPIGSERAVAGFLRAVAVLVLAMTCAGCSSVATERGPDSSRVYEDEDERDASADAMSDTGQSDAAPETPPRDPAVDVSAPEVLGFLVGGGASVDPPELELYGSDLGWSLVHDDELFLLFGDSMPYARFYCDERMPVHDDIVGRLPLEPPDGSELPRLQVASDPEAPTELRYIELYRDGRLLESGIDKTPLAAFSDGEHAFAFFGQVASTTCEGSGGDSRSRDCPEGLTCSAVLGQCDPVLDVVRPCELATHAGCYLGQSCIESPTGFCIDEESSQYDGSAASERFAVARDTDLGMASNDELTVFESVALLQSKKFHNPSARTVAAFGGTRAGNGSGNDYGAGHGQLLVWGRPGFVAEHGRQAQLYLLTHKLPLAVVDGRVELTPRYFAGVDASGEPRWSSSEADAQAIAMDGKIGGDPSEPVAITSHYSISWIGTPIEKWVMLYAGDLPDAFLVDPVQSRAASPSPGAILMRFADHPWGPFSEPEPHLLPGDPAQSGDGYGPGGILFHYACEDSQEPSCAKTDPVRPLESYLPGCPTQDPQLDIGRFYGVSILDAYTRATSDDHAEMLFTVSTWNPYGVALVRTRFERSRAQPLPAESDR